MGCSSCSSGKGDGAPAGCGDKGNCGTGGCNKLNVYDWLSDMVLADGQKPFPLVEVRFKGSRKEYYRNESSDILKPGDIVALEANPGHDVGTVSLVGELVKLQMLKKNIREDSEFKALYRKAKPAEIEKWEAVKKLEFTTMHRARKIAVALNLSMKLSDVEYQGDGKKTTFFYTAEDRVDFRELIVKLAEEFRVRIEMRQIGMRQEAARLGGIGSCGRELCCSTWLTDFKSVSTSAARYQNLALNPLKLAGQCGKLKCCLNYELDSYMDALRDIPDGNTKLFTESGVAYHRKTDIFKRLMWFEYFVDLKEKRNAEDGPTSGTWVMLPVDRVIEIVEMNKQKQKPSELRDEHHEVPLFKEPDYADVVGQDSLTRMDKSKTSKKKKKKKKNPSAQGQQAAPQTQRTPDQPNKTRENPNRPNKHRNPQSGGDANSKTEGRPERKRPNE